MTATNSINICNGAGVDGNIFTMYRSQPNFISKKLAWIPKKPLKYTGDQITFDNFRFVPINPDVYRENEDRL